MTPEDIRAYCLSLPDARESFPFGPYPRLFAAANGRHFVFFFERARPPHLAVKCDPMKGEMLRAACPSIRPGYHMNKRHWISLLLDGGVPDEWIRALIFDSFALVRAKPPVKPRRAQP